ncbi:MAG: HAMP domain-containing sensor histidine kinase [Thermoleophilia bacterium]
MKLFLAFLVVIAVVVAVVAALVRGVAVGAVSAHMGPGMDGMMGGMMGDMEGAVARGVSEALLWGALAAVVAAAAASYVLSGLITGTIGDMAAAARRIAAGQYSQRVAHGADDEIGGFADAFNEMASRLEETEQVRRELLATISHELRTPLTSIQGYMEGLLDGVIAEEPETYQLVHREAARLSRLVADIENLSRIEAGAERIVPADLDVRSVLEGVADRVRPQFEQKPLSVKVVVQPSTPRVRADEDRLLQVLLNVVGNAFKYTPPGGTVDLRAEPAPGDWARHLGGSPAVEYVLFQVGDSGIGIPEQDLPHVFERFYRVDKSRSSTGGGLGIGLAVARGLVEQMGGSMTIESAPGRGTTLSFALPAARPPGQAAVRPPAQA